MVAYFAIQKFVMWSAQAIAIANKKIYNLNKLKLLPTVI